jgi:magnesium transporter
MPNSKFTDHRGETAQHHMVTRVPTASAAASAGSVLAALAGNAWDYADAVYVLDAQGRLDGLAPLTALLAAPSETRLGALRQPPPPAAYLHTDQEHVASLAIRHNVTAVPILDAHHKFLGVVPPQALLEVLRHEHVEDLHRLAGIRHENTRARHAIEAPPLRRARDRLPWLLAGLAGSVIATLVMASYESALNANIAIAFFVPGIVYLADAIGTQTETIAVRGLSLSHAPFAAVVGGEARTGALIGLILALCVFFPVWWWFGDVRLATAVAVALFTAGTAATTIGVLFPWAIARLGRDPAFGSGPMATIVQDVLSLMIYFVTVGLLL